MPLIRRQSIKMPTAQPSFEQFVNRANDLRRAIADACAAAGRSANEVELLAVTKTHGPWAADYAARYGLRGVGENRVQEGAENARCLPKAKRCGGNSSDTCNRTRRVPPR